MRKPFHAQDIHEVLESMSSDDCLRVWDALLQHVSADFDAEHQVAPTSLFTRSRKGGATGR
jgi:hypothetical protein